MTTSWALRALILVAVDANAGRWCTLDFLVGRVVAPKRAVQEVCDALVTTAQMQQAIIDGEACYGVKVDLNAELVYA